MRATAERELGEIDGELPRARVEHDAHEVVRGSSRLPQPAHVRSDRLSQLAALVVLSSAVIVDVILCRFSVWLASSRQAWASASAAAAAAARLAGRVDLLPLVLQEVLGALLDARAPS